MLKCGADLCWLPLPTLFFIYKIYQPFRIYLYCRHLGPVVEIDGNEGKPERRYVLDGDFRLNALPLSRGQVRS